MQPHNRLPVGKQKTTNNNINAIQHHVSLQICAPQSQSVRIMTREKTMKTIWRTRKQSQQNRDEGEQHSLANNY